MKNVPSCVPEEVITVCVKSSVQETWKPQNMSSLWQGRINPSSQLCVPELEVTIISSGQFPWVLIPMCPEKDSVQYQN